MTDHRCTLPPSGKAATAAARYRSALPVLKTERLELRAPTMDDLPAWTRICSEAFKDNAEQCWTHFSYYAAGWMLHGHGSFAVCLKGTQEAIGFVVLGLEWGDHEPELGYFFDADFHGQGFATEAVSAVRNFGLDLLGPGEFVSYVSSRNDRSNALAERIGGMRDPNAEAAIGPGNHVWRHGVRA